MWVTGKKHFIGGKKKTKRTTKRAMRVTESMADVCQNKGEGEAEHVWRNECKEPPELDSLKAEESWESL